MMMKNDNETRFGRKLETLFWWILRLYPLIHMLVCEVAALRAGSPEYNSLSIWLANTFGDIGLDNFVLSFFERLFSDQGVLPFFTQSNYDFFVYMSWLVLVELSRFFINFLLWIIRFANHLLERFMR